MQGPRKNNFWETSPQLENFTIDNSESPFEIMISNFSSRNIIEKEHRRFLVSFYCRQIFNISYVPVSFHGKEIFS